MLKHHLIRRTLTGGLVIAAVGLPASAQAMPITGAGGSSAPVVPRTVTFPVTSYSLRALRPHGSAGAASVWRGSQSAFHWGDAGIGAAGAALLGGAAAAGFGMTRRRRNQRALVS